MANVPTEPLAKGLDPATGDTVLILRPYPVRLGQKITIEQGPGAATGRSSGWASRLLRRRGPISHQELDCDWFCYVVTEAAGISWPHQHSSSATSQPA